MKLPKEIEIFANTRRESDVYEAIVRDCSNQYIRWLTADTLTTFDEWLCYRYDLESEE